MKKLASLLVLAIMAGALLFPPRVFSQSPSLLKSTRPLYLKADGGPLQPICTTSIISEKKHYWLTAHHCLEVAPLKNLLIDGKEVELVKDDKDGDIAVLKSDAKGLELGIAEKEPNFGDEVKLTSYMGGVEFPTYFEGKVANPSALIPSLNSRTFMILNIAVASGASGSPIVNSDGKLVSIAIMEFLTVSQGAISPLGGGVPYQTLKGFLKGL